MTNHSLLIRDPPQKMMSSALRLKPACHGQAPGYATSPPTIRLGFLTPQVSGVSVGAGDAGVGCGAGVAGNSYKIRHEEGYLLLLTCLVSCLVS